MSPKKDITGDVAFSVLIPARDEEDAIAETVRSIAVRFAEAKVTDYEILVVNDRSSDATGAVIRRLSDELEAVRRFESRPPGGFGSAVRTGLAHCRGRAVAVVMADGSESAGDVLLYYQKMKSGARCVFGSRFIRGADAQGYPPVKMIVNRLGNLLIAGLFGIRHGDITNAFKAYHRDVLRDVEPLESQGFELSVELPLKAVLRGHPVVTVPISWKRRTAGRSKFGVLTTSVRYLRTLLRLRFRAK